MDECHSGVFGDHRLVDTEIKADRKTDSKHEETQAGTQEMESSLSKIHTQMHRNKWMDDDFMLDSE